jgi:hypothetical protein
MNGRQPTHSIKASATDPAFKPLMAYRYKQSAAVPNQVAQNLAAFFRSKQGERRIGFDALDELRHFQ